MADIIIDVLNEDAKKSPAEMINKADGRYHAIVDSLAEKIAVDDRIRIVLLAGPSGSGKTTTANLLSDAIISHGLDSVVVSLDNFYRAATDPEYPRLENGERDFEAPEALNLSLIEKTLSDIADGKPFEIPRYDFKIGGVSEVTKYDKISHGCVIIEGLHALNPAVFSFLPKEKVLGIFISVSTNIYKNDEVILSGRKLRFIRRMVRDSLYRGADARKTLELWTNVLRGEDKYLYPCRENADVSIDSFHSFEPSVMRSFVLNLISEELALENPYAGIVLSAMKEAVPMDAHLVPDTSLIREFIPGGKYEALY